MKNVVPISREDEILEAASRWVLRIESGELTLGEKTTLEAWLDENIRHQEVLEEVAAVWDKSESLARLAELFPHDPAFDQTPNGRWYQGWAKVPALAAGFAVMVVSLLLLMLPAGDPLPPTMAATYESAIGEQKTVVLPDGNEHCYSTHHHLYVLRENSLSLRG